MLIGEDVSSLLIIIFIIIPQMGQYNISEVSKFDKIFVLTEKNSLVTHFFDDTIY